jgi:hypothetical protein
MQGQEGWEEELTDDRAFLFEAMLAEARGRDATRRMVQLTRQSSERKYWGEFVNFVSQLWRQNIL